MSTIDELFPSLMAVVHGGARGHGFVPAGDGETSGEFGARVSRWRRGSEEMRLAWNPKEQWINFEYRPTPDQPPALEWTGTLTERYSGGNISDGDATRLREALAGVAATAWERRPAS